jgi:hypothetical protein
MKNIIFYSSIFILLVMHAVGFYGIIYGDRHEYVQLTGINLLISFGILLLNFENYSPRLFFFLLLTAVIGFFIEVIGVKTQMIFGTYHYGEALGTKQWEVPLMIGINWSLLIFSIGSAVEKLNSNIWTRCLLGAILMILIDILIEPVAIKLGYWSWDSNIIPLQNYLAWGTISFALFYLCFHYLKNISNKTGIYIYIVQLVFFSLLNLIL